ncbi:hypothetical protein [Paenibacillus xylanexedens]|uniref:hypothetical protein n=1 Tax=Paenibacillus xylanexedens TaxID=528191 RepID=UPI0011A20CC0|nr:hypothetical protein [Paenibacillus xylanexedens]
MNYTTFEGLMQKLRDRLDKYVEMKITIPSVPGIGQVTLPILDNVQYENILKSGSIRFVGPEVWFARGGKKTSIPAKYRLQSDSILLDLNTGDLEIRGRRVWQGGLVEEVEFHTILQSVAYVIWQYDPDGDCLEFQVVLHIDDPDAANTKQQDKEMLD